jgi:hypothetical protein
MEPALRKLASALKVCTPAEVKASYIRHIVILIGLEDWHGVADAANDLREFEARHPELKGAKLG